MRILSDARIGQRFRFAQLGDANAQRAGFDLPPRDLGTLVRLGVRPELNAALARKLRHMRDVAFEHVEIDDERRRLQLGPAFRHSHQIRIQVARAHDLSLRLKALLSALAHRPSIYPARVIS